jgi:hypothetical protein
MILHDPFIITARLLSGIKIGDAVLSLDTDMSISEDAKDFSYSDSNLQSGVCGFASLVEVFETMISFMEAAGEAVRFNMSSAHESDNSDLFPPNVMDWCYENADELYMLSCDLQDEDGNVLHGLIEEDNH